MSLKRFKIGSNRIRIVQLAMLLTPLLAWSDARAQAFTIEDTTIAPGTGARIIEEYYQGKGLESYGTELEDVLNKGVAPLRDDVSAKINSKIEEYNFKPIMHGLANAGVAALHALPVDYATNPDIFTLSLGLNMAASKGDLSISELKSFKLEPEEDIPAVGVSATPTLLLGINFGAFVDPSDSIFDLSRLSVYGSFSYIPGSLIDKLGVENLSLSGFGFGFYGQYKLVRPIAPLPGGLFKWGGVDVMTGLGYSSFKVGYETELPEGSQETQVTFAGNQNLTTRLDWSGKANLGANMNLVAIPIEASTNVQLLYALSLYVGAGFDINMGSANLIAKASAPATVSVVNPNNSNDRMILLEPEAKLDFKASSSPTVANARGFGGVQLNLPVVKIFGQASYSTTNTLAVSTGLRFAW